MNPRNSRNLNSDCSKVDFLLRKGQTGAGCYSSASGSMTQSVVPDPGKLSNKLPFYVKFT